MPPPDALRHLLESQYREALAPVTERLFAAANIAAGQRVLDVGTGGGDTALLAAERTGPQGFVLATDTSLDAVQGLLQRLRDLPRPLPIEVEPVAAEFLALEPESFDVAIARSSVMYFGELLRALGNVRAALRPGGRFVASVYGPLATRLTYIYLAARLLGDREPSEIAADALEHLEKAHSAIRLAWGSGAWPRFATAHWENLDASLQDRLVELLGESKCSSLCSIHCRAWITPISSYSFNTWVVAL